ncbi:DUF2586 domain-containing protein [Paraprevotella clara]|jgi:hypothetical protein|uniref:DUF2586 domain-containing protein n=1 Tax=Paraprevotella clara TaxID=454154 RepID=UPI0040258409
MLPRIKISYLNGQLGTVGESPDGLFALVCGATAVGGTFELEKAYSVRGMDDLAALGITSEGNPRLYKHVKEFYDEAEEGTELVVYGVAKSAKMTALLDKTSGSARKLVEGQNGRLRGVFVAGDGGTTGSVTEGLDPDVLSALPIAQQLAEWATEELYAPLFVILEGRGYTGEGLRDLSELAYNRVGVLIGDTEAGSEGACVGTLAGRLATLPVQRNVGRVKDGALFPTEMYVGNVKVDEGGSVIAGLYDKGYITPRKYVGRSGYFFTDDRLACDETDDYAHLAHRRVIDKAYRIVYDTLLDMMLDELEVNEDGTLQAGIVKSWQQAVEDALNVGMTASGELSAGDDGEGCVCYIDQTQNVLATSKVAVTVKVRPFGYARYVDVSLGFQVTQAS